MRIAHLSDLHFGDPKTLSEVERCTTAAVDEAVARGAELAVISGDSTDHAIDVHSPSFLALARLVRRLADHCPVLMLQGTFSHEPPGTLEVFRLLAAGFRCTSLNGYTKWRGAALPAGWRAKGGVSMSCQPMLKSCSAACRL